MVKFLAIPKEHYPKKLEEEFYRALGDILDSWEEKYKHFSNAQAENVKGVLIVANNVKETLRTIGIALSAEPVDVPIGEQVQKFWTDASTPGRIAIVATAPLWIPAALVVSPVILISYGIRKGVKKLQKAAKEKFMMEKYDENAATQKIEDARKLLAAVDPKKLIKEGFGDGEAFATRAFEAMRQEIGKGAFSLACSSLLFTLSSSFSSSSSPTQQKRKTTSRN